MCGVAGVVNRLNHLNDFKCSIASLISHRGPDDSGSYLGESRGWSVRLYHSRLSIIDLSTSGHQPMIDPISGSVLVFNGEIYNYLRLKSLLVSEGVVFVGTSDTEVLLHALRTWGLQKATSVVEGMFAFAYWNQAEQSLSLVRDISGIKPLYFKHSRDLLVFASEVRAVAKYTNNPEMNNEAIATFLTYGAYQQPDTPFQSVQSVSPGTIIVFSLHSDTIVHDSTVSIDYHYSDHSYAGQPLVHTVKHLVRSAVQDHLLSDVPVAVFLSAGIDSTVIASIAAQLQPSIHSFTIGSEQLKDNDECIIAADTAMSFGIAHTAVSLSPGSMLEYFSNWLSAQDTPSIDGLNTYVISHVIRQYGFKVALSGLGSDEIFCGYPSFVDVPKLMRLKICLRYLPKFAQRAILRLLSIKQSEVGRMKLHQLIDSHDTIYSMCMLRRQLYSPDELQSFGVLAPRHSSKLEQESDIIAAISKYESRYYQGNMLLRDSDVMSMAHGVELRTPFLDQRLVQYVSSLPGSVRHPYGTRPKHLLRQAFADIIPDAVTYRKKTGFVLPIRDWMMGPMRDLCEHSISICVNKLNFDRRGVQQIWSKMLRPDGAPFWSRVLALVSLGHYVERHSR